MSTLLWALDPAGVNLSASSITDPSRRAELEKYFPTWDKHDSVGSWYRADTTNIYKTKDGKFFHLHGESCLCVALTDMQSNKLTTEISLTVMYRLYEP